MEVVIKDEIVEAIEKVVAETGESVEEFVNGIITYSFDNGLAVLQMQKMEELLTREILPRIMNIESNEYAVRHQVTNIHNDILDGSERAVVIAKEASEIGEKLAFGEVITE